MLRRSHLRHVMRCTGSPGIRNWREWGCLRSLNRHFRVEHINAKISNRLDPATAEKLVYVYSNSKLVASTCYVDKLKISALQECCSRVDRARPEALRCRGAESLISARGARRESRLRASVSLGQPCQERWLLARLVTWEANHQDQWKFRTNLWHSIGP